MVTLRPSSPKHRQCKNLKTERDKSGKGHNMVFWESDVVEPAQVLLAICNADNFSLACRFIARSEGASASQYLETAPVGSNTVSYVLSDFVFFFAFSLNVLPCRVRTIGMSSSDELACSRMSSTLTSTKRATRSFSHCNTDSHHSSFETFSGL